MSRTRAVLLAWLRSRRFALLLILIGALMWLALSGGTLMLLGQS